MYRYMHGYCKQEGTTRQAPNTSTDKQVTVPVSACAHVHERNKGATPLVRKGSL